jgi:hypothetical protein
VPLGRSFWCWSHESRQSTPTKKTLQRRWKWGGGI